MTIHYILSYKCYLSSQENGISVCIPKRNQYLIDNSDMQKDEERKEGDPGVHLISIYRWTSSKK